MAQSTAYQNTARAFSLSAPLYDQEQGANLVATWSRRRSLAALRRAFAPGERVVELGCGTGVEAIRLARQGVHVLATDIAPNMVAMLEGKLAQDEQLADRISTRVMPGSAVGRLADELGAASFDGAYSSFGALNCEPSLEPVAEGLARLVRPGGKVVISLINRFCLWETGWYLLHANRRDALRRWGGRAEATVRGEWQALRVPVYYWTPGQVEQVFAPYFKPRRRVALPWLLPPQYLDGLLRRAPGLFTRLARLDRQTAHYWPAYLLGDHFLLQMERA